jgi:hypothetical protein
MKPLNSIAYRKRVKSIEISHYVALHNGIRLYMMPSERQSWLRAIGRDGRRVYIYPPWCGGDDFEAPRGTFRCTTKGLNWNMATISAEVLVVYDDLAKNHHSKWDTENPR